MRPVHLILVLVIALPGTGCALIHDAVHATHYKASETARECLERHRNWSWAEQAWEQTVARQSLPPKGDYSEGFKEGFAEHLYRGGSGEPPVLPPTRYRRLKYQSLEGYQAAQNWFAGYRHGASIAQTSGFRNLVIGPNSLQGSPVGGPGPHAVHADTQPLAAKAPVSILGSVPGSVDPAATAPVAGVEWIPRRAGPVAHTREVLPTPAPPPFRLGEVEAAPLSLLRPVFQLPVVPGDESVPLAPAADQPTIRIRIVRVTPAPTSQDAPKSEPWEP